MIKVNYDIDTKKVLGFYPEELRYASIPEPTISITKGQWQSAMTLQSNGKELYIENGIIIGKEIQSEPIDTQTLYEERVVELIRQKYTLSQELAILRQQETKPEEYQAYYQYCEQCKVQAKIQYNIN